LFSFLFSNVHYTLRVCPSVCRNDEIQTIRAIGAGDLDSKVMRAKLEYKVISEFSVACREAALAICDGLLTPLSYGEPGQSEIYVYNGIFFSKAEDSKDSFKICNGDEAYKKSVSRDLQNLKAVRTLGTLICRLGICV
jgi:protein TIF31